MNAAPARATAGRPLLELLSELHRLGVRLALDGDALDVAPDGALTPELRARLRSHEAELAALMRRRDAEAEAQRAAAASAAADPGEDSDSLPPILAGFVSVAPARSDDGPPRETGLAAQLGSLDAGARAATLLALVRDEASAVLEVNADAVEPGGALNHLGFDSLMAIELRDRLQAALGVELSVAELWKDPRPIAIAEQLLAAWLLARVAGRSR